ncbi:MAG: hypothetical protein VYE77_11570 [Planctomycetota bacterium]|nr:hypothetical protein [Planctomycetota bacterium]
MAVALLGLAACAAGPSTTPAASGVAQVTDAPAMDPVLIELVGRKLKRSVAVPKFDNATDYGRDRGTGDGLTLGGHVSAVVSEHLTATQEFLPFDPDSLPDSPRTDYLVRGRIQLLGVMEPPRSRDAATPREPKAVAEVRLEVVATATNRVLFEREGRAERLAWQPRPAGKLTDETARELVAEAVGSVMDDVVEQLLDSPWSTSVLMMYGANCVISGGSALGLKVGDQLVVCQRSPAQPVEGEPVAEFPLEVARIQIESSFGGDSAGEASICKVISGDLTRREPSKLVVQQQVYAAPLR